MVPGFGNVTLNGFIIWSFCYSSQSLTNTNEKNKNKRKNMCFSLVDLWYSFEHTEARVWFEDTEEKKI